MIELTSLRIQGMGTGGIKFTDTSKEEKKCSKCGKVLALMYRHYKNLEVKKGLFQSSRVVYTVFYTCPVNKSIQCLFDRGHDSLTVLEYEDGMPPAPRPSTL